MNFMLQPGKLTLSDIRQLLKENIKLTLDPASFAPITAAEKAITNHINTGKIIYGINTGFGALANTIIPHHELENLQLKLILSHAAGTGELLNDEIVKLILLLKINSLARGYSGIQLATLQTLIDLFNAHIYPCIPAQGSVGASGDLAPLAHMSLVLIGLGEARHNGKIISGKEALAKIQAKPLQLAPKEGLALLNGTQASTAIALSALFAMENVFAAAICAGALSLDAIRGSDQPFDERISEVKGHSGQLQVAHLLRELLQGSAIRQSHYDCEKVQDPYSFRCQPQVMGAILQQMEHCAQMILVESNAVSDNPLIFTNDNAILSGGNFHAEPIAFAADIMAIAIAEIGALAERRIAALIDPRFSGLPAFLVKEPGLNSGFMIAQVTAAALASENKSLAHPASVDSIPTSANQEDHVSMATFAARRLLSMLENTATIIAIELLASAQGIHLLRPLKTSQPLEALHHLISHDVPFYTEDRYFAPDIAKIKLLVQSGKIRDLMHAVIEKK